MSIKKSCCFSIYVFFFTDYTVKVWPSQSIENRKIFVLQPKENYFEIADLSPSTEYSAEVFASTQAGHGSTERVDFVTELPPGMRLCGYNSLVET